MPFTGCNEVAGFPFGSQRLPQVVHFMRLALGSRAGSNTLRRLNAFHNGTTSNNLEMANLVDASAPSVPCTKWRAIAESFAAAADFGTRHTNDRLRANVRRSASQDQ